MQADRDFIQRELAPFLPERIFDAHAHLFRHEHFQQLPAAYRDWLPRLDLDAYYDLIEWIHPGGRTLRLACWLLRLNAGQIEDIFYSNAMRLFTKA